MAYQDLNCWRSVGHVLAAVQLFLARTVYGLSQSHAEHLYKVWQLLGFLVQVRMRAETLHQHACPAR